MLDTYCDESLVETVKAQIPDEPPIGKRWDKPKVEVRDHLKVLTNIMRNLKTLRM